MNKKLLMAALAAALVAPLAANAGMKVYGNLSAEIGSITYDQDTGNTAAKIIEDDNAADDKSGNKIDDNKRGRLGMKASEDLGGGLKATAAFEWQVETTQAQVDDGARHAHVGLKGGFGHIKLGALKAPYKYTGGVKYDAFVTTFGEARSTGGMLGKGLQMTNAVAIVQGMDGGGLLSGSQEKKAAKKLAAGSNFGQHSFFTDALGYSAKFGPVHLGVQLGLDEFGGSKGANGDYNASVKFKGSNFEVFVAGAHDDEIVLTSKTVESYSDPADQDGSTPKSKATGTYTVAKVGGQFKFKTGGLKHKISAQYESGKLEEDGVYDNDPKVATYGDLVMAADGTNDITAAFLGYILGIGKTSIVLQLGQQVQDKDDGVAGSIAGDSEVTTDYRVLGVIHKFSKKSRVFASYRTTNEETDKTPVASYDTTKDTSIVSLGMRVDF